MDYVHDTDGSSLCIHSVVCSPDYRRCGVATAALCHYAAAVADSSTGLEKILLISKERLLPLYSSAGFSLVGLSEVVHGADDWFEMALPLAPSPDLKP